MCGKMCYQFRFWQHICLRLFVFVDVGRVHSWPRTITIETKTFTYRKLLGAGPLPTFRIHHLLSIIYAWCGIQAISENFRWRLAQFCCLRENVRVERRPFSAFFLA